MRFECPRCGYSKEVISQKFPGRKTKCPKCRFNDRFPGESEEDADDDSLADSACYSFDETMLEDIGPGLVSPAPVHTGLFRIQAYAVNRGPAGISTSYFCPACRHGLVSSLSDAGEAARCPSCGFEFIVPGESEYKDEATKQAADEKNRKKHQEDRESH